MKKKYLISLAFYLFLNVEARSQSLDTIAIVNKIKVDLSSMSKNCWTSKWYVSFLKDSFADVKFLNSKGFVDISFVSLNCHTHSDSVHPNICNYFGVYGKALYAYDHLTNELVNLNIFNEGSRNNLKSIFQDRLAFGTPLGIIQNKHKFLANIIIEDIDMKELFIFLKTGKKTSFNNFGKIKWQTR